MKNKFNLLKLFISATSIFSHYAKYYFRMNNLPNLGVVRAMFKISLIFILTFFTGLATAQNFPTKPITIVVRSLLHGLQRTAIHY